MPEPRQVTVELDREEAEALLDQPYVLGPQPDALHTAEEKLRTALQEGEGEDERADSDRAVVSFSGGPLDVTGGVVDLSRAPIHLALPWEHGSYVFAGTEGDGDGGWFNYEWKPRADDEDFPEEPQALVVLTDPARELRRVWNRRVRFLLERAEEGIDADADDLRGLLDGVDHPAAKKQSPAHPHDQETPQPKGCVKGDDAITNLIGRAWEVSVAMEGHNIEPELRQRLDEAMRRVQGVDRG